MKTKNYYQTSLSFICYLESCKTKVKNLHWSAPHLTYHRELDALLSSLSDYQDEVAETSMGYLGTQYDVNELKTQHLTYTTGMELLNALIVSVNKFCSEIDTIPELAGITNATNDFQQELLKFKYLFSLAERDGSTQVKSNKLDKLL